MNGKNGIYLLCLALLLNIMFLEFFLDFVFTSSLFLFVLSNSPLYEFIILHFIYSSIDGHLGCSPISGDHEKILL